MGTYNLDYSSGSESDSSAPSSPRRWSCDTPSPRACSGASASFPTIRGKVGIPTSRAIGSSNPPDAWTVRVLSSSYSSPTSSASIDAAPIDSQPYPIRIPSPILPSRRFKNPARETNFSLQYKLAYIQRQKLAAEARNEEQQASSVAPPRLPIRHLSNTGQTANPSGSPTLRDIAFGPRSRAAFQAPAQAGSAIVKSRCIPPDTSSMSPSVKPADQPRVTRLNPSRKRAALANEFDLHNEALVETSASTSPAAMSGVPNNAPCRGSQAGESSRAFSSCFNHFQAPWAFIQSFIFAPLASAVLSLVSNRSNDAIEIRTLANDSGHLSVKRVKTSISDHEEVASCLQNRLSTASSLPPRPCQSTDYRWAESTTERIGKEHIDSFYNELTNALSAHGVSHTLSDDPTISHVYDDALKRSIRAAICTIKVLETFYMSPDFPKLYHKGDPKIRPNLSIGSTKQAQETLSTAVEFVEGLLKDGARALAPSFATPKSVTETILQDILAMRDGCIPPSLTIPVYGAYREILKLEEREDDDELFGDPILTSSVDLQNVSKFRRCRPLPSLRPKIPGILKKAHNSQGTPKRLASARSMKIVKFRFPLEQASPLKMHTPFRRFGSRRVDEDYLKNRIRAWNKDPHWQEMGKSLRHLLGPTPPLPGEGLPGISGEPSLSWDKVQKQREQKDREEQEKAERERRRREAEERAKAREKFLRTAGLKPARASVLEDPTPDMVHRGNHATLRPLAHVATAISGTELHGEDFRKLVAATEWLNDEAVNGLLEALVHDINTKEGRDKKKNPKVVFVGSLGLQFVQKNPVAKLQRPMARQGITPQTLESSIETILVPRCQNSHWTLGVIRPKEKVLLHLDSLRGGSSPDMIDSMRKIVHGALQDEYVASDWDIGTVRCSRQTNGYDCGMFTIANSICVSTGALPECDGRRIRNWRYTVSEVLLKRTFNGISSLDLLREG
ncbi:hypothetical protein MKZ38_002021 [Zalerion maritima]|uniref:Ubiquitin-like protease family profile domain-containing protein n=1 Tax=Zalerion maritima TaxID=339359 RepID=A0AAD5RQX3_9PEZI|nr:hypothetical protein MKZ38_002021 [Zalerion maritima]